MLEKMSGPECRKCGCQDAELLHRHERTGTRMTPGGMAVGKVVSASSRYRCRNCGASWMESEPWMAVEEKAAQNAEAAEEDEDEDREMEQVEANYAVPYHLVRCPNCGSENTKIASTKRPIRYHKCNECEFSFKSVEK